MGLVMPKIESLFTIRYGHSYELNNLTQVDATNGVNFVSRTNANNGVSACVIPPSNKALGQPGELTVSLGGTALAAFLQPEVFVCGYHIAILTSKHPMTDPEKLYWAMCIRHNRYRYSYGRQANRTLQDIELPETIPAWVNKFKANSLSYLATSSDLRLSLTSVKTWKSFRVDELFIVHRGKYVQGSNSPSGNTMRISASSLNNGHSGWSNHKPIFSPGTISVARDGSIAEAFYQPRSYFATDSVHVWEPIPGTGPETPEACLFVTTIIRLEKPKYHYGRKWGLDLMKQTSIKLPALHGKPDWNYMTRFIQGLPFSSAI